MVPPVYPTLVRSTPFVAPNSASAPQKQPMPRVAVSKCSDSTWCNKFGLLIESFWKERNKKSVITSKKGWFIGESIEMLCSRKILKNAKINRCWMNTYDCDSNHIDAFFGENWKLSSKWVIKRWTIDNCAENRVSNQN